MRNGRCVWQRIMYIYNNLRWISYQQYLCNTGVNNARFVYLFCLPRFLLYFHVFTVIAWEDS